MEKKYLFFDVDGTLTTGLKRGNDIPKDTLEAIQKLKDAGHFLSLATGRPYFHAKVMSEIAGIDNIVCNGGYGAYLNGKELFSEGMNQEELYKLIDECDKNHIAYGVSVEGEDYFICNSQKLKDKVDAFNFWAVMEVDEQMQGRDFSKITRMLVDKAYLDIKNRQVYEDIIIMYYQGPFAIAEPNDKIGGIKRVMEHLDVPFDQVVCFGDGHNDIDMLKEAPLGIAMGNGVDEVKAVANYVTSASSEGGILQACKHFGWI
jgi:HAD-superfamily hydrolase, subfamily IIB